MKKPAMILGAFAVCLSALAQTVEVKPYGKTAAGENVEEYILKNDLGMSVKAITYGATITEISAPDKFGNFDNVVLNLPNLAAYESNKNYICPIVGRYGNRLANSQFKIGEKTYNVDANEGKNSLHGGKMGFNRKVWKAEKVKGKDFAGVKMSLLSHDGDMGFPGNMNVEVFFKLDNCNNFTIQYRATTDKPTVCNLTWHPYFNLAGAGNGSILTHHFFVNAKQISEVDEGLIPTGKLIDVKDTPFDFTSEGRAIGERLTPRHSHPQLEIPMAGGAYDHNFILDKPVDEMGVACKITCQKSGRVLKIITQEPCLQFYSGQGFDGTVIGANGKAYYKHAGMVVEPQHAPDQPNQPNFFPSTLLTPGEVFTSVSVYNFSTTNPKEKKGGSWLF